MTEQEQLNKAATDWAAARDVIADALREWRINQPDERAGAIIGRLASHQPPILLKMEGELQQPPAVV